MNPTNENDDLDFIDDLLPELDGGENVESDPEPEPEPAEPGLEPEPTASDPEPEDWAARFEAEEKRRKDSQKSFQDEHQARLQLERELAELRQKAETAEPEVDDEFDEDAFYEDPAAALKMLQKQARESAAESQRQTAALRMELLEEKERSKHSDYDDLVSDFLVSEMHKDPLIQAQWRKAGGTPEKAYEMAKRLRALSAPADSTSETREEMEARIRKEITEEQEQNHHKRPGRTLSGHASAKPPPALKRGEVRLPETDQELLMEALAFD